MKKQSTTPTETAEPRGKQPSHRIYAVNGDADKATWTPIGACWVHKDGKGLSISATAIPLQGRIVIREFSTRDRAEGGQQ